MILERILSLSTDLIKNGCISSDCELLLIVPKNSLYKISRSLQLEDAVFYNSPSMTSVSLKFNGVSFLIKENTIII